MIHPVFLHGLGQTASSWQDVLPVLGGADVLCPSLFQLPAEGPLEYPALYQALCAYLDEIPGQLFLCGLSLGGVLALDYAVAHPSRLACLALIGTPYVIPKRLLSLQNAIFRLMPAKAFLSTGLPKADMIRLTSSMCSLDFRQQLGEVSCPVLTVCGERDRANLRSAKELARLLPNGRLRVVPKAGHEVNVQAPGALGEILREFLNQNS